MLENNRTIAEFMLSSEHHFLTNCIGIQNGLYQIGEPASVMPNFYDVKLLYNSSWDWLMPVISKITRDEKFIEQENREYILDIVGYGHIEDVFEAVIGFIKWYNQYKLNETN